MSKIDIIEQFQRTVNMKNKVIMDLREELEKKNLIIKGMNREYKGNYHELSKKFTLVERRIMDFLYDYKGEWVDKDIIVKRLHIRYPNSCKRTTIGRSCRKLAQRGSLLKDYPNKHPFYTLNLRNKK